MYTCAHCRYHSGFLSMQKEKLLVIALSGIGDALMFTPALQLIKKHKPELTIDALVMYKGVEDIYTRTGLFDKVHYFNFLKAGAVSSLSYVLKLRGLYSHSINVYPANRKEYNIIAFLMGAKTRGGINYKRAANKELGFLNNVSISEDDTRHNVMLNALLAGKMFGFSVEDAPPLLFSLTENDKKAANEFIASLPEEKRIIGFHTGCSLLKNHIKRRWEPEKFIALATKLITEKDAVVLLFGGPDEAELNKEIHARVNSEFCRIVVTSNLAESAAIMKHCDTFVSNDSALMHVAAAMQKKVIAIIGPTNTAYIHPWKTEYTIASLGLDCAPCFFYSPSPLSCSRTDVQFKCIKELSVEYVYGLIN